MGICLGPYGGPRGGAVSYERGTPVLITTGLVEGIFSTDISTGFRVEVSCKANSMIGVVTDLTINL